MKEADAYVIEELRLYGAPGETHRRVLWVDRYTLPDGSSPDLDFMLEQAQKSGGIDGAAKTISIKKMVYT